MTRERYANLDGLRAYACIGIILMHVIANGNYGLTGFIFEKLIPSFTDFTYLFMMLSAFSMCCGYYEKFINREIDLEQFYKRRYNRIWPFFMILCSLELLMNWSVNALYEWVADITLVFGLIPDHKIEVIGVGWFLGTIFVFYMIFPFFVFLLKTKKRAWLVLGVAIILHILCRIRFISAAARENIIYSSIFFLGGGLLYLYRHESKKIIIPAWFALIGGVIFYYCFNGGDFSLVVLFAALVVLCILCGGKIFCLVFNNKIVTFLAAISMEVYLCHMLIYRALERLGICYLFDDQLYNYLLDSIITIIGAILLSYLIKNLIRLLERIIKRVGRL